MKHFQPKSLMDYLDGIYIDVSKFKTSESAP